MWSGILPKLLRRFQSNFPNATIELHNMRSPNQVEAVRCGRVDIGFVSFAPSEDIDLEVKCVSEESSMLVMNGENPLARKRRLIPRDLDRVRWILLSESLTPEKPSRFLEACAKAGFTPEVVQRVAEPMTLLALVEAGLGVGLVRSSARNYAPSFADVSTLAVVFVYNKNLYDPSGPGAANAGGGIRASACRRFPRPLRRLSTFRRLRGSA